MLDKNILESIKAAVKETAEGTFNDLMEKTLLPKMEETSVKNAKKLVEQMNFERAVMGHDFTGLSDEQKKDFAKQVYQAGWGNDKAVRVTTKANEALIEEQDNRGGYLVAPEVADAILRIAASVGTIMSQAQRWTMKTDELGIPNYTGAFLTGSYIGVDLPGTVQGLTFGQAVLIAKKWQLAFVVGNDLLADSSVNLAEWLLAIAGESLANMIDYQGFVGVGQPFRGILTLTSGEIGSAVTNGIDNIYYLSGSSTGGKKTFADFDVLKDSSAMIGLLEESILDGSAFYMHRTVWANLRVQETGAGFPILPFGGLASPATLQSNPGGGPVKPAGEILGYAVFTNRWLPKLSDSPTSQSPSATPFVIFGNMKALAFGDKGDMRVAQYESGSFGGKEVALSDQRGIVYKHRHSLVISLPKAFVIAYTDAS